MLKKHLKMPETTEEIDALQVTANGVVESFNRRYCSRSYKLKS